MSVRMVYGTDPTSRLPPGQTLTTRFPVLHAGSVQPLEPEKWSFHVFGLVREPLTFSLEEFKSLPAVEITADIHCVTHWSKYDTVWVGVTGREILRISKVAEEARFAVVHAPEHWSSNLPIADLDRDDVLFAWLYDGKPLAPEHGAPVRLVVPHLYFWKSAKWVNGVEFVKDDRPGYWESGGYHMRGDPWKSERFRDDPEYPRRRFPW